MDCCTACRRPPLPPNDGTENGFLSTAVFTDKAPATVHTVYEDQSKYIQHVEFALYNGVFYVRDYDTQSRVRGVLGYFMCEIMIHRVVRGVCTCTSLHYCQYNFVAQEREI